jgi:hypothetical protein
MSDIMSVVVPLQRPTGVVLFPFAGKQKGTSTPWALQDALGGYHLPGKYLPGKYPGYQSRSQQSTATVLKISKHPVFIHT